MRAPRTFVLAAGAAATLLAVPLYGAAQDAARLGEARDAYRTGRWDQAIDAYRDLVRGADAPDPEALRGYGRALAVVGRYDDAIEALSTDAAGGLRPRDPGAGVVLGDALRARGRDAEAEDAYRAAIDAGGPQGNVARLRLALLLDQRGEREQALDIYDSFIDLYNGSRSLTTDELVAVGTAVRELSVTNPTLVQDALLAYDGAAEQDPGDPRPPILTGELFLASYNAPDAHASFDEVLARTPEHPDALLGKARVLDFDGDAQSMRRVEQALEVNPNHVEARAFRARLLLETEDHDQARAEAERALEVNDRHLGALSVLAAAHYLGGDRAAYEEVRDRVLALNPRYPELFNTVAELAVAQRRYTTAVELAGRAVRVDSTSARAHGLLGMNLLRTGRIEEGRAALETAFERDPYNPWYKNNLDLLDTFPYYETVETEHFELFLHGREADLLAPYVAEVAENAYATFADRYGVEPPLPIRLELFPSSADFSVRTLGVTGLGALGVSFGSTVVMDSPSAREPGDFNWASTLWHELAHAFHLGMTEHRVPRWFSEGLAVYEQRSAQPRWGLPPSPSWLQSYAADRMPPVSELNEGFVRPRYPEQVIHSYYQASLVFEMIDEEHGFDAILAMLDGYRRGRTTSQLVREVLETTPDALDDRFDDWVNERFRARMAVVAPLGEAVGPGLGVEELRQMARRSPRSFQLHLALGRALHEEGRPDEAEAELRTALDLFPEYGGPDGPLRWLAEIHEERGETRQAAEAYHRLGRLSESAWQAHAAEARLRAELDEPEAEVEALEKAVEIVPLDIDLHERLADAYRAVGEAEEEVGERRAVLALDPADRAEALYRLAAAHHRAGDREAARSTVLRALEIAPSYDEALELLLEIRGGGA